MLRKASLIVGGVLLVVAVFGVLRWPTAEVHPFADRDLFVDDAASAERLAAATDPAERAVLERLLTVPTTVWVTPEEHPDPSRFVGRLADRAEDADAVLVLAVYGITDRDCTGRHSAGGLPPEAYRAWIDDIADEVHGDVAVILEPDALASAPACARVSERTSLLAESVDRLDDAGATVYLDAGHSNWVPPGAMADLLEAAGIERARGFATNVANFRPESAERSYAERVSSELDGAHYVIDTSRNGAGTADDWCNPPEQALGREPEVVDDDTALDAYLWIKPPGESDGACGGGPAAGTWWPERALELAENAGWR